MTREPRVNFDRLVSQIVLDCSLLRWFAYNGLRDDVTAAIALQRTRAKDTESQVLDFRVRHLAVVAPGIAEALPATAFGLAAAIALLAAHDQRAAYALVGTCTV